MNKYRVCVYAICKNEEQFVNRWVNSMKEADDIYVLDTGSTDTTVSLLKSLGVHVETKIIKPWRFDDARNASLDMIKDDYDIFVCTDLDEVFNKGWRSNLEDVWDDNINRLYYVYNWSLDENNVPKVSFYYSKIHKKDGYRWVYPVHEVLESSSLEVSKTTDKIILNHYPDSNKSRSSYLKLLEQSVKEYPLNDRNMHYLGREYMYYNKNNEAIDTLIRHLNLKSATWKDERCASMRFIARCYVRLKRYDEAFMWLNKAIKEAPYLRDPYVATGLLYYDLKDYENCKKYLLKALKIKNHEMTYINEVSSWDNTIYDVLSIAYFNLGKYKLSLKYVKLALSMDKNNERLLNNLEIIKQKEKDVFKG